MKSLLAAVLLITTFTIISCHSTPSETLQPDYDISQLSKDYVVFEQGSKWTYQDDSTLQKSVVEVYSSSEEIRTSSNPPYTYRAKWMWYAANNVNLQRGEVFASNFNVGETIPNSAERIYFMDGHYKIAFAPFYPVGSPIMLGGEEGIFINKELLPTMTLNGKTYNEVYHSVSEDLQQEAPDTVFYHFYIAKNYGLIKYTVTKKDYSTSISLIEASLIP
jgi:hypothetical protein